MITVSDLKKVGPNSWEIPKSYRDDMRCNARLYAPADALETLVGEQCLLDARKHDELFRELRRVHGRKRILILELGGQQSQEIIEGLVQ